MSMTGLDSADRQRLAEWLDRVRHAGIDAVIDFAARPWGSPDLEVVIGVFETGRLLASWLLVRYQSQWVLATVDDETISAVRGSLAEALALIPLRL